LIVAGGEDEREYGKVETRTEGVGNKV